MSFSTLPTYEVSASHSSENTVSVSGSGSEHPLIDCIVSLSRGERTKHPGEFVKTSKYGGITLRLLAQADDISLPEYGQGDVIEGSAELSKMKNVSSVEVKIEGRLILQEIAEAGTDSPKLFLKNILLWTKSGTDSICPLKMPFSFTLPKSFTADGTTYPLPPTYDVLLPGIPGFRAHTDYSVTIVVHKSHFPTVTLFGLNIGNSTLSTPFTYIPLTRPTVPLPLPMPSVSDPHEFGVSKAPEWRLYESHVCSKLPGESDVMIKFCVPASRVFCISQPIPFHLVIYTSASSLISFLPFLPIAGQLTRNKHATSLQLMRHSTVAIGHGAAADKTDMWKTDCIGEGSFKHAGDGANWVSFTGEITAHKNVNAGGFKAAGLVVKDCIILTVQPPNLPKAPFSVMKLVVPVRLATDPWVDGG